MPLTFLDLQNRVIAYGYGEADRTIIKDFLNQAREEVEGAYPRWDWLQESATVTAVAGTRTVAMPTGVVTWGRLQPAQADLNEPQFLGINDPRTYEAFHTHSTVQGMPTRYGMWENIIYFDPIPQSAYAYTAWFWKQGTQLSGNADEPLIPDSDRDILVYGALSRLSMRDRSPTMAQLYSGAFSAALKQMMTNQKANQTQTTRRAAMPPGYLGVHD